MPPIRRPEERIGRTLARLAPGTLGGTLDSAARPVTPVGDLRTPNLGGGLGGFAFYFRGLLVTSVSMVFPAGDVVTIGGFTWAFVIAGTTDTVVSVEVNGVSIGSFTIPASGSDGTVVMPVVLTGGDRLQLRITSAGAAAEDLTVVPQAA